MATAAKTGPQDLPPRGGYGPIQIERIKLRSILGVPSTVGLFIAATIGGSCLCYLGLKQHKRHKIEMRSSRFAIFPTLLAERDRAVLKHMRRMREEEADLMKDVDGWEVGTYFGDPIFKSLPDDTFIEPSFYEYFIHSPDEAGAPRLFRRLLT